ncbi:MAG: hypothetical protein GY798_28625 [Hyphomicrobiales bacterium]|nr:hypothetical protein [Hyphomicrobiales bacterium]
MVDERTKGVRLKFDRAEITAGLDAFAADRQMDRNEAAMLLIRIALERLGFLGPDWDPDAKRIPVTEVWSIQVGSSIETNRIGVRIEDATYALELKLAKDMVADLGEHISKLENAPQSKH